MASGHVNRINRPNTWMHRPTLRREEIPCQPGAVHMCRFLGRLSSERVDGCVMQASEKPAHELTYAQRANGGQPRVRADVVARKRDRNTRVRTYKRDLSGHAEESRIGFAATRTENKMNVLIFVLASVPAECVGSIGQRLPSHAGTG